ncbi:MAG TPA: hypothetical protein VF322_10640 [Gammaproteobacteria bacterium]
MTSGIRARHHALASVAALAIVMMSPAAAQPDAARFELRLGGQKFTSFTTAVRLDSVTRGIGTQIRLETDVNLEQRVSAARIEGIYNFGRRHHIGFATYDIDRTGTRRVERSIRFRDETFTLGTTVSAALDQDVAKIAYRYDALSRRRATLGPSFGLHVMRFEVGLSAAAFSTEYDAKVTAPLPVVGVRGGWRFAERWRLLGSFEWFDIEVSDIDGRFTDATITVEHDTFERFGFGLGFNGSDLDVESGDEDFLGIIDLSFSSAIVYFRGTFGRKRSERQGGER